MYQFKYLSPNGARNIKELVDSGRITEANSCDSNASPDIVEVNNYVRYLLNQKNNEVIMY